MFDLPTPEQLLAEVARFLREAAGPALATPAAAAAEAGRAGNPALAYQARVAANMAEMAARQWQHAPAAEAAERQRLQQLLQQPDVLDLAALNRLLAQRLADGTLPGDSPALAAHLWATTLDKLAVDQPGYDTYLRHRPGEGAAAAG